MTTCTLKLKPMKPIPRLIWKLVWLTQVKKESRSKRGVFYYANEALEYRAFGEYSKCKVEA